jgi:hypothetical protein
LRSLCSIIPAITDASQPPISIVHDTTRINPYKLAPLLIPAKESN